ncbi:hypothetical protein ANN_11749 [Periplaneta americana]|uniref:Reverse transcriptase n=1 Tax=Periplaneta americana TaxID=6978 RepID=A0ABQ8T7A8_PERAM|nr:hypothetical protein ANN_11749 [Periplaneta americana]
MERSYKNDSQFCAVRSLSGRSQEGTPCRHCRREHETLAHVLGFCPYEEVLRNSRHHIIRGIRAMWDCGSGLATDGSSRRIDIIAFRPSEKHGSLLDPTVRFESHEGQPEEVDSDKSSLSGEASCKADLNNFKEKLFRGRVSIRDLWLNVPVLSQLSYPGTPPDTVSTFSFISTQLAWADETPETRNSKSHRVCVHSMWVSGASSAHASCVDIKGKVETMSGGVPGSSVGRALNLTPLPPTNLWANCEERLPRWTIDSALNELKSCAASETEMVDVETPPSGTPAQVLPYVVELLPSPLTPQEIPVWHEGTGEWRKLHNTELHALYSSPDIIRNIKSKRLRWAGHVARMSESRNAYRELVGRPEGKRSLGRPRRRWEDNIKMDLREVGYDDRDWINLAEDRDR